MRKQIERATWLRNLSLLALLYLLWRDRPGAALIPAFAAFAVWAHPNPLLRGFACLGFLGLIGLIQVAITSF
jgi:hypothetical protein